MIDSHAHYSHAVFTKPLRYLSYGTEGFSLQEGSREQLFRELHDAGIPCSIEPGISLQSCDAILALSARYPGRIYPAMGIHPTRCLSENWSDRKKLAALAARSDVIAIGETGLDYHYKREEQHRLRQHIWFLYQLDLAWRLKKPLILHIRDAHEDALRILRLHPARKWGGVVHCFNGSRALAEQYLKLGFHIGIGGSALQQPERAQPLWDAIAHIPPERILVETDAPFILPYCKDTLPPKLLRRTRNTSLILPAVIARIAQLKNMNPETVARLTAENTIRLFSLPLSPE